MKKKIAALIMAVLTAGMFLASCSGGTDTPDAVSGTAGEAGDTDFTEIDVILDWYPNAVHAFLYEAEEKGYFEEEGIKVNIISPAESIDAITFTAAGKADIGFTYPVEIIQAVEKGMPVKALAAVCSQQLDCMASLASNKDITADMSSLKGKQVGYSGTSLAEAAIRTITRNAGLKDSDYELLNVGFDLVTSLTTGSVDMVAGIFENDEAVTMELAGYELNVYFEKDYGFPEMYGLVMAVNSESYKKDPEIYEGFLNACQKGFDDIKSDKNIALNIISNTMNSADNPLDMEQQERSYDILMTRMESEEEAFLEMSDSKWDSIISWMKDSSLITSDIKASDVMINSTED